MLPVHHRLDHGQRASASAILAAALLAFAAAGAHGEDTAPVHHTSKTSFNIGYDAAADQDKAELWATENGGADWTRVGFDPDNKPPVGYVADHDATYGFSVVVQDIAGNRSEEPREGSAPQVVVVVDTRKPFVELLSPRGGAFGPARGVDVVWRAADEFLAPKSVTIEMSRDGGATWSEIARGLPGEGSFPWRPRERVPEGITKFRFRVNATDRSDNKGSAASPEDVLLDEKAPNVVASSPAESKGIDVSVVVQGEDPGGAGIESIRLYYTTDGGATWQEAASTDVPSDPVEWRAPASGTFGLYAAATDLGGNASPAPAPGTKPQLLTKVTAVGPIVSLKNMNSGGYYRGGSTQPVVWEASGRGLTDKGVSLEYSVDGGKTWEAIASDLPSSGQFDWTVPKVDTTNALLRVRAASDGGEESTDASNRFFVVDSTPPRSVARFEVTAQATVAATAVATPPEVDRPKTPLYRQGTDAKPRKGGPLPPPKELTDALKHMGAGQYDAAIALLKGLLAREPANVRAHLALGESIARHTDVAARRGGLSSTELLRRFDEAAAAFRSVLKIDADSNDARVWLGLCHLQRGRLLYKEQRMAANAVREWELATTEFEKSLALPPDSKSELTYAGTTYYMLQAVGPEANRIANADRAQELLERSLVGADASTSAGAHWYLAELAARKKDTARALEHWHKALELYGENSTRGRQIRGKISARGGG